MILTKAKLILLTTALIMGLSAGEEALALSESSCKELLNRVVKPYRALYKKLPPKQPWPKTAVVYQLIRLSPVDCVGRGHIRKTLKTVVSAVASHSGRVGVMLPISGKNMETYNAVLEGMKGVYPIGALTFPQRAVVKNTVGSIKAMELALAEMVFRDQVGMLIGGATAAEAGALSRWADRLMIPTLILSQMTPHSLRSKQLFHVFPNEVSMVNRLTQAIRQRRYKRIAVLQPIRRGGGGQMTHMLISRLKKSGVRVDKDYVYSPGDYESMEAAAKKVFNIVPADRPVEFQKLVNRIKRQAKEAGLPFNPSLVSLPPQIDVDAIFIPDNFRTVRHFVNIFKFLGVEEMPLIGTQEWRAKGLIDPPEPFLDGSFFVDYIGDYRHLPARLRARTSGSGYFVRPEETINIDYRIIGWHAMGIAEQTMSKIQANVKRRLIYKTLEELTHPADGYFPKSRVFSKNHNSIWPAWLFRTSGQNLVLEAPSRKHARKR